MRRLPAALALAVVLMIVLSGPVLAAGTVHQVTNAGNDPFAACTVGAGTGINYPRSEVEPFGTVNPELRATPSPSSSRTAGATVARTA